MNESIFLISFVLASMISLSLLAQIFRGHKSHFFLGIVTLIFSFELLFSWGTFSGYNANADNFPISLLLYYTIIPPSLWIFVQLNTNDNFKINKWQLALFLPFLIEVSLQTLYYHGILILRENLLWIILSEYIPLVWMTGVMISFWIKTSQSNQLFKFKGKGVISNFRFFSLMCSLSLLNLFWIVFSFIGWQYFEVIEYTLIFLFFTIAFLIFLEQQSFQMFSKSNSDYTHFNDEQTLQIIESLMENKKPFLKPHFPIKELAQEIQIPSRYISFLINHKLNKNYKEYINSYRVEYFLTKAQSKEISTKTILALALESGFNSKSTFNTVFKSQTGKTPSEYLK